MYLRTCFGGRICLHVDPIYRHPQSTALGLCVRFSNMAQASECRHLLLLGLGRRLRNLALHTPNSNSLGAYGCNQGRLLPRLETLPEPFQDFRSLRQRSVESRCPHCISIGCGVACWFEEGEVGRSLCFRDACKTCHSRRRRIAKTSVLQERRPFLKVQKRFQEGRHNGLQCLRILREALAGQLLEIVCGCELAL